MSINYVGILISFAGLLVAIAVYFLSKQQLRESWLKNYGEIHTIFWNDEDIKTIRYCIAYEKAYEDLRRVLVRRRELYEDVDGSVEPLVQEEYVLIDKLDKFLNLFERAAGIRPELNKYRDLWKDLFFQAWLDYCLNPDRSELNWYMEKFYSHLVALHKNLKDDPNSRIAKAEGAKIKAKIEV